MISFIYSKHKRVIYIIFFSFFLNNCQLNESNKAHGINFLNNREKILIINKTNKNDVIKLIGNPHTVSIKEDDIWIYFERTTAKGKLIKLGKNVLKENNILELKFNKYGILTNKKIYNIDDMKKVKYSTKETKNDISQQSFVGKFLSSIKQKMYGKQKF
jgi:outer membrane protein assembly factor BamE (lipoprotein component of BamABCDE complex)